MKADRIPGYLAKWIISFTAACICWGYAPAQDKSQAPDKLEAIIQSFYKKAGTIKTANAKVTAKRKDGKAILPNNLRVNFYILDNKVQKFLNKAYTDEKGNASIDLPKNLPLDNDGFFNLEVKLENDSLYQNTEETIHCKEANLMLKFNPKDTAKLVTAKLTETGSDGIDKPIKDVEVNFYVQRLFGDLFAAEDHTVSTNENGEASFNYPNDIPGDTLGNITLIVRVDDNDKYGNIESRAETKWGVPLEIEKNPFPRALWEPRAPVQMIITFSILFGGVWITYFFIFFQLFRLKKEKDIPETKDS